MSNTNETSKPSVTVYKDNKVLTLNTGEKFPFSFGVGKAKLILANIDAIKKFVETEGKEC